MKKLQLIVMLVLTSLIANAQNCFWAKRAGGTNYDQGKNVATDLTGNVYVTGVFTNASITFGTITVTNPSGMGGYFLVKYDPAGNVVWAKGITGASSSAEGIGITTDATGNIYVSGTFYNTTIFGGVSLTAVSNGDLFVVKYDPSGNVIWAKSAGGVGTGNAYANSVAVNGGGDVFITGFFNADSIKFGSITLHNYAPGLFTDGFIAKYNSAGTPVWAKKISGNREDVGNAVAADSLGNSYVVGTFRSDVVNFGADTLQSSLSGARYIFVAKYDSLGNSSWRKGVLGGADQKYDIATYGGDVIIGGPFAASPVYGLDTLHCVGSGYDAFVAKYDFNGNAIWAKSGGGSQDEYCNNISVDAGGNIYSGGFFQTPTMTFGTTVINRFGSFSNTDIFIAKYNPSGALQWVKSIGEGASEVAYGMAAGLNDNVYFTGKYNTTTAIGSTPLSWAGGDDFFVADLFNFNSAITSSTNVSCFGNNDGAAVTTISGGNSPYTYAWGTSPVQTTSNASSLVAGTYSVVITEGYGCAQTHTVTITEPAADEAIVCMVTVDSSSQNNIIIWDKTGFTTVDTFEVFREITTGNYQPIGSVPFDSLSQFIDTVRTLYFPNTGNPNNGTYRYKVQAKSTCGTYGPMSPYHNTIFIINSSGTFSWPQLYTIEGGSNPVMNYVLMRDDFSTGAWHPVASVSGTQQVVSDPQYGTYSATGSWRIETFWSITCVPTRTYATSISNRFSNVLTGVKDNAFDETFSVYPNPSNGLFTLEYKSSAAKNQRAVVEVWNLLGEKVFTQSSELSDHSSIDLSGEAKGVYFLKIKTETQMYTRKIAVQ